MDTATLRTTLDAAYQENRKLLAGLSETDMDRRTSNPRWRVRQLAAHIALDERGMVAVGKLLARGKNAKAPGFVIDLMNWWSLRKQRTAGPAGLLAVMDGGHQQA